jgi:ribosomal protein L39E
MKFFKLYAFLFEGQYAKLSNDARVLYSFMLDRAALSAINADKFTDKNGNLYIIYTIEQIMVDLQCSKPTAVKVLQQLEKAELIRTHRHNRNKPSFIYVKYSSEVKDIDFAKSISLTSRSQISLPPEVKNFYPIYNDPKNTKITKTDNIISANPNSDEKFDLDTFLSDIIQYQEKERLANNSSD